jgi:hypothetical protein
VLICELGDVSLRALSRAAGGSGERMVLPKPAEPPAPPNTLPSPEMPSTLSSSGPVFGLAYTAVTLLSLTPMTPRIVRMMKWVCQCTQHARYRKPSALAFTLTRRDTTRHDTTRHDTTRHDTTRHDTTRHDTTRQDTTRHDTTRQDTTNLGVDDGDVAPDGGLDVEDEAVLRMHHRGHSLHLPLQLRVAAHAQRGAERHLDEQRRL